MNKHNRKISRPIRIGLSFIIAVALIIVFVPLLNNVIHPIKYIASSENTLTVSIPYIINGEVDETTLEIPRGTQVHISEKEPKHHRSNIKDSWFQYQTKI